MHYTQQSQAGNHVTIQALMNWLRWISQQVKLYIMSPTRQGIRRMGNVVYCNRQLSHKSARDGGKQCDSRHRHPKALSNKIRGDRLRAETLEEKYQIQIPLYQIDAQGRSFEGVNKLICPSIREWWSNNSRICKDIWHEVRNCALIFKQINSFSKLGRIRK